VDAGWTPGAGRTPLPSARLEEVPLMVPVREVFGE
jgi:hypothetical protein